MKKTIALLRNKGIRPTNQRVAVGQFVLNATSHPRAEDVVRMIKKKFPFVSRASVYNTLDLFVRKGLLQKRLLKEDLFVYDPLVEPHHHFIDETTGSIIDVPLNACKIKPTASLRRYDIREYHIVMRGKKK